MPLKSTVPPSENVNNLSYGDFFYFFGKGLKGGFIFLYVDAKYLCMVGDTPTYTSACSSCKLDMGWFHIALNLGRRFTNLKKKGIEWLVSKRCKHSKYWQIKKTYTKLGTEYDKSIWVSVKQKKLFTAVQEDYGNQVKHFSCNIHEQYKHNKVFYRLNYLLTIKYSTKRNMCYKRSSSFKLD